MRSLYRHRKFLKILSLKEAFIEIKSARLLIISSRYGKEFSTIKIASNKPSLPIVSIISKPWRMYQARLATHPMSTKCITSGVIYGIGDIIAQKIASPDSAIDRHRFLRGLVYGSVFLAPLAHFHFNFLDKLVVTKLNIRKSLVPFVKVYFDQFVYWAPSIVCIYHLSMGWMEGLTLEQVIKRFEAVYWKTLKANWTLWAPMMLINFTFIPVAHQLNFCLMVGMVWSSIISYIRSTSHTRGIVEQQSKPLDTLSLEELKNLPHCSQPKHKTDNTSTLEIKALPTKNELLQKPLVIAEIVTVNASTTKPD